MIIAHTMQKPEWADVFRSARTYARMCLASVFPMLREDQIAMLRMHGVDPETRTAKTLFETHTQSADPNLISWFWMPQSALKEVFVDVCSAPDVRVLLDEMAAFRVLLLCRAITMTNAKTGKHTYFMFLGYWNIQAQRALLTQPQTGARPRFDESHSLMSASGMRAEFEYTRTILTTTDVNVNMGYESFPQIHGYGTALVPQPVKPAPLDATPGDALTRLAYSLMSWDAATSSPPALLYRTGTAECTPKDRITLEVLTNLQRIHLKYRQLNMSSRARRDDEWAMLTQHMAQDVVACIANNYKDLDAVNNAIATVTCELVALMLAEWLIDARPRLHHAAFAKDGACVGPYLAALSREMISGGWAATALERELSQTNTCIITRTWSRMFYFQSATTCSHMFRMTLAKPISVNRVQPAKRIKTDTEWTMTKTSTSSSSGSLFAAVLAGSKALTHKPAPPSASAVVSSLALTDTHHAKWSVKSVLASAPINLLNPPFVPHLYLEKTKFWETPWPCPSQDVAHDVCVRYKAPWRSAYDPLIEPLGSYGRRASFIMMRASDYGSASKASVYYGLPPLKGGVRPETDDDAVCYINDLTCPMRLPDLSHLGYDMDAIARALAKIDRAGSALVANWRDIAFENWTTLWSALQAVRCAPPELADSDLWRHTSTPLNLSCVCTSKLRLPMLCTRATSRFASLYAQRASQCVANISLQYVEGNVSEHVANIPSSALFWVLITARTFYVDHATPEEAMRTLVMHDALHNTPMPAPRDFYILDEKNTRECLNALTVLRRHDRRKLAAKIKSWTATAIRYYRTQTPVPELTLAAVGSAHTLAASGARLDRNADCAGTCTMLYEGCAHRTPDLWNGRLVVTSNQIGLFIAARMFRLDVFNPRESEDKYWELSRAWADVTIGAAHDSALKTLSTEKAAFAGKRSYDNMRLSRDNSRTSSSSADALSESGRSQDSEQYTPSRMTLMLRSALLKNIDKMCEELWPKQRRYQENNGTPTYRCRAGSVVVWLASCTSKGHAHAAGSWYTFSGVAHGGAHLVSLWQWARPASTWMETYNQIRAFLTRDAPDDMNKINEGTFTYDADAAYKPAARTSVPAPTLSVPSSSSSSSSSSSIATTTERMAPTQSSAVEGGYSLPTCFVYLRVNDVAYRYLANTRGLGKQEFPRSLRSVHEIVYTRDPDEIATLSDKISEFVHNSADGRVLRLPALVAILTDAYGKPQAHQLTYLHPYTHRKADVNVCKRTIGKAGGNFVYINEGDNSCAPIFLAEGVETCLSIRRVAPYAHIFASCGIDNLGKFDMRRKLHSPYLYVFVDEDPLGAAAITSLHAARIKLERLYRVHFVRMPRGTHGKDVNDLHQHMDTSKADDIIERMILDAMSSI